MNKIIYRFTLETQQLQFLTPDIEELKLKSDLVNFEKNLQTLYMIVWQTFEESNLMY